jgi:hypothetical protein
MFRLFSTKAPSEKPTGLSPISFSSPSSQTTSSPSASVNNAYEEKALTSGGVYDPSSCSSSKQPVIIGGSGNFVSLEETQKKSVLSP